MKFKELFFLSVIIVFISGCNECKKLNLNQDQEVWVSHYKIGQQFYYTNSKNEIDTLEVKVTNNYYTPCNKMELSQYQFEVYLVSFILKSKRSYNNDQPYINVTTEEWKQRIPYIYFGNLGPHRNDLENSLPIKVDTLLNGQHLKAVYYYSIGQTAEQYGENKYFKNFFWDKKLGLIAYTTINDEVYVQVHL